VTRGRNESKTRAWQTKLRPPTKIYDSHSKCDVHNLEQPTIDSLSLLENAFSDGAYYPLPTWNHKLAWAQFNPLCGSGSEDSQARRAILRQVYQSPTSLSGTSDRV